MSNFFSKLEDPVINKLLLWRNLNLKSPYLSYLMYQGAILGVNFKTDRLFRTSDEIPNFSWPQHY